jgi:hypothetical protein
MRLTIELLAGPNHNENVTQSDMQKNIDALTRAIEGKPYASDFVLMNDTRSILEGIKRQLPLF